MVRSRLVERGSNSEITQRNEGFCRGSVKDQLKRAATSIPLNIAEGAGKITPRDQSKYYAIARGSALECGAIYDLMKVLKVIGPKRYERGKRLLVQIASMLSKMIK